jgi:hypothetical protein
MLCDAFSPAIQMNRLERHNLTRRRGRMVPSLFSQLGIEASFVMLRLSECAGVEMVAVAKKALVLISAKFISMGSDRRDHDERGESGGG